MMRGNQDQEALGNRLEALAPDDLDVNLTVQGGGGNMLVMMHSPASESVWEDAGAPANIVARFATWCEGRRDRGAEQM
jgi:hypothetical protein